MTERMSRDAQIVLIDRMLRDVAWNAQKHVTYTLTDPEIDLTFPQLVTLFAIYDSKSCRMSELADTTRQSAGTLTGIVDRLIIDGLVERTRNGSDRRVVEVALTPMGEARLLQAISACQDGTRRVLASFDHVNLDHFATLLQAFLQSLHTNLSANGQIERVVEA